MKITTVFTYSGGPLDGQRALPTSKRGQQYTLFRGADGQPLRPATGDRYTRAEAMGGTHPGFYSKVSLTGLIDPRQPSTLHGEYRWNAPRTKAGTSDV